MGKVLSTSLPKRFLGNHKLTNTYHTLGTYTVHVRFMQMSKRAAASLGDSLLAKALSYAFSVVKADRVQDRASISHVCIGR